MDMHAGHHPAIMNSFVKVKLELRQVAVQPPLEIRDMDINIHLNVEMNMSMVMSPWVINMVVNRLVKPNVVNSGKVIKTICMDAGCPSMVVNPREMSL
jgi:hypothetical protein